MRRIHRCWYFCATCWICSRQLLPAQYDSVNVQGKPEIYCGLLTLVLLPLFYMNKKINWKKKAGLIQR